MNKRQKISNSSSIATAIECSPSNPFCYDIPVIDLNDYDQHLMPYQDFITMYKSSQAVLFRNAIPRNHLKRNVPHRKAILQTEDIHELFQSLQEKDKGSWCIENSECGKGNHIDHAFLHTECQIAGYCSFLVQHDSKVKADLLTYKLPITNLPVFTTSPFSYGPCLWFFFGRTSCDNPENQNPSNTAAMQGRSFHTDSISHDGTWHYQLSGTKVWCLKPTEELIERWKIQYGKSYPKQYKDNRIECKEGDIFFVNTRLWWHRTDLPQSQVPSVSYARDVYLSKRSNDVEVFGEESSNNEMTNLDGIYAANAIEEGTIIFRESEMPDCELFRSSDPNCEIVELDDGSGAIVSIRNIKAGEFFTVLDSDEEDSVDEHDDSEGEDDFDENDDLEE